jgi:hypothetical protein
VDLIGRDSLDRLGVPLMGLILVEGGILYRHDQSLEGRMRILGLEGQGLDPLPLARRFLPGGNIARLLIFQVLKYRRAHLGILPAIILPFFIGGKSGYNKPGCGFAVFVYHAREPYGTDGRPGDEGSEQAPDDLRT